MISQDFDGRRMKEDATEGRRALAPSEYAQASFTWNCTWPLTSRRTALCNSENSNVAML